MNDAMRHVSRCDGGGGAMTDTLTCGHTRPAPTKTWPWDPPVWRECAQCRREALGALVRATWVTWAAEQPDAKAHWLTPWETLDAGQREVDMRIGEAVASAALAERDGELARLRAHIRALRDEVDGLRAALPFRWEK